jgi:hypothetical protein
VARLAQHAAQHDHGAEPIIEPYAFAVGNTRPDLGSPPLIFLAFVIDLLGELSD